MQPDYFSNLLSELKDAKANNEGIISHMDKLNLEHRGEIDERRKAIDLNNELILFHAANNEKLQDIITRYSEPQQS